MTNSLKEEIMYIVGDFKTDTSLTAEQRAEKILNLIEKLIDELKNTNLVPLLQYTLSSQEEKTSMSYYHKALQDVKEILKK